MNSSKSAQSNQGPPKSPPTDNKPPTQTARVQSKNKLPKKQQTPPPNKTKTTSTQPKENKKKISVASTLPAHNQPTNIQNGDEQKGVNKKEEAREKVASVSEKKNPPVSSHPPASAPKGNNPPPGQTPKIKTARQNNPKVNPVLLGIMAIFFLSSIAAGVLLIKKRQTVTPSATETKTVTTNVTADDTGRYGVRTSDSGTKDNGSDYEAFCCVTENQLEIPAPAAPEGYEKVNSINIESHDHTADVAYNLEVHTDSGWQTIANNVDVATEAGRTCGEENETYPDHGYPDNPNTADHNDLDKECYATQTHYLGCMNIDKIRLRFHSTQGDDEHDKGEHVHIGNVTWEYCAEEVPNPTPTPEPPQAFECRNVFLADTNWNLLNSDDLVGGQEVYAVVAAYDEFINPVDKARFKFGNGQWQETTNTVPAGNLDSVIGQSGEGTNNYTAFYVRHTTPTADGESRIQAEVHLKNNQPDPEEKDWWR